MAAGKSGTQGGFAEREIGDEMHFAVCVVTRERPTQTNLRTVLAPFKEADGSTDPGNPYVVDVNITKECINTYKTYKNNSLINSKKLCNTNSHFLQIIPNERIEITIQNSEIRDFISFIESVFGYTVAIPGHEHESQHASGYVRLPNSHLHQLCVIRRNNPNSKWDYWNIGGRFSGLYVPNYKPSPPGWPSPESQMPDWIDESNQFQRKNLQTAALKHQANVKWAEYYDRMKPLIMGKAIPSEQEVFATSPVVKAIQDAFRGILCFDYKDQIEEFRLPRSEFLAEHENAALSTYAYLKDGEWHERPSVEGMFYYNALRDGWASQFNAMLDSLDPEDWISVVDCHC